MRRSGLLCSLFYFLYVSVFKVCSAEVTVVPEVSEVTSEAESFTNSSEASTSRPPDAALSDHNPAWEPPKAIPDFSPASDGTHSITKFEYKPLGVHLIQKFANWVRPAYEKWSRFKDFLAYPDHPNHGGALPFNPQEIWEKWHEKGHHFLTGINGAIYGLAPMENQDYPFAYRRLESPKTRNGTNGRKNSLP